MKKLNDNSVLRFVKVAVTMAENATTKQQLERLYNSGSKYDQFLGERMGSGFYSDTRYNQMLELRFALSDINAAVEKNIGRVEQLELEAAFDQDLEEFKKDLEAL